VFGDSGELLGEVYLIHSYFLPVLVAGESYRSIRGEETHRPSARRNIPLLRLDRFACFFLCGAIEQTLSRFHNFEATDAAPNSSLPGMQLLL
jgi:hypothetical protein